MYTRQSQKHAPRYIYMRMDRCTHTYLHMEIDKRLQREHAYRQTQMVRCKPQPSTARTKNSSNYYAPNQNALAVFNTCVSGEFLTHVVNRVD